MTGLGAHTRAGRTGTRRGRRSGAAAALAVALVVSGCGAVGDDGPDARPAGVPDDAQRLVVDEVVDGDTVRARALEAGPVLTTTEQVRVRLVEIGTPEVYPEQECYGPESTDALEALTPPGSRVWAVAGPEPQDRFGRELLYLWTEDGTFVQESLVREGYAEAFVLGANDRYERLLDDAERDARGDRRGRWSACAD